MAASREKLVRNAEKFVSRGRIEAAIREYRKVLEDQPRDTGTLNRVGDLYARINRIDEAVRLFTQIAEQYTEEGFFVKAIAIYKKIIKLDPTRLSVYEKLAELYHRQGLVNEARTQYQVLADYYAKHENSTSAISIYQQMASLEPDDPSHRVKLAELYKQGKLNDKAMEQYQLIADIMLGHGTADQAVQVLKRGLEIDPQDLDYLARAVDKLRAADQSAAARELLTAAKEHNPAAESLMPAEEEEAPEEEAPAVMEEPAAAESDLAAGAAASPEVPEAAAGVEISLPEPEETGVGTFLGGDTSLQEALAEAEAAVSEDTVEEELTGGDDFLIGWDEEEADSLIRPPADMAEAGPDVTGTGFRDAEGPEPAEAEADLSGSWELDLESLDLDSIEAGETSEEASEPAEAPTGEFLEDSGVLESVSADGLFETVESEVPGAGDEFVLKVEEELGAVGEDAAALSDPGAEFDLELDLDLVEDLEEPPPGIALEEEAPSTPDDLLSEAEVLAKYGLKEKAFHRVQEVLDEEPDYPGALRVLIQLHLEEGEETKVRELAERLRQVSQERQVTADWDRVEELFAAAAFTLDKTVKKRPKRRPKKKPATDRTDRIDRLLASLMEDDTLPKGRSRTRRRDRALDDLFEEAPAASGRSAPVPPPSPELPFQQPLAQEASAQEAPVQEAPSAEPVQEPVPFQPGPVEVPISPPSEGVDPEDHSDIEDALAGMSPVPAPSVVDSVERKSRLEETGTSWLDEVEASRQEDTDSSEVFEEEEGFFVDLAAELEEELTVSDALGPQQTGEQSLEEIVQGFKRGVEEQLSEGDYATHFDLGIAYREMGLLDEAIGEFQVASKAPEHMAACCSMLGICFLEKGLPELAIKWYTRGLASPGVSEDDSLALLYDLATVYLTVGDTENARKTFVEVYGINSHYRDVPAKLAELNEA